MSEAGDFREAGFYLIEFDSRHRGAGMITPRDRDKGAGVWLAKRGMRRSHGIVKEARRERGES
jgi:hypothetical protein